MPAHVATPAAKQPLGCVAQVSSKRFLIMGVLAKDHKEVGSGIEARLHQCMGIAYIRLDNDFESPSESSMCDHRISGWGCPVFVGPAVAFPCDIQDPLSQDG